MVLGVGKAAHLGFFSSCLSLSRGILHNTQCNAQKASAKLPNLRTIIYVGLEHIRGP